MSAAVGFEPSSDAAADAGRAYLLGQGVVASVIAHAELNVVRYEPGKVIFATASRRGNPPVAQLTHSETGESYAILNGQKPLWLDGQNTTAFIVRTGVEALLLQSMHPGNPPFVLVIGDAQPQLPIDWLTKDEWLDIKISKAKVLNIVGTWLPDALAQLGANAAPAAVVARLHRAGYKNAALWVPEGFSALNSVLADVGATARVVAELEAVNHLVAAEAAAERDERELLEAQDAQEAPEAQEAQEAQAELVAADYDDCEAYAPQESEPIDLAPMFAAGNNAPALAEGDADNQALLKKVLNRTSRVPAGMAFLPTELTRAGLIRSPANNDDERARLERQQLAQGRGIKSLFYDGPELGVKEETAWLAVLMMAKHQMLGTRIYFEIAELLKACGMTDSTDNYKAMRRRLSRLAQARYEIDYTRKVNGKKRDFHVEAQLLSFETDLETGATAVWLDPAGVQLYSNLSYQPWDLRLGLNKGISQQLLTYVSGHTPDKQQTIKVSELQEMFGYNGPTSRFIKACLAALQELEAEGVLVEKSGKILESRDRGTRKVIKKLTWLSVAREKQGDGESADQAAPELIESDI